MKAILILALLLASVSAASSSDIDIWTILTQVEEIGRGTGFGVLTGMKLVEASKCFQEMNGLVEIIKGLKKIIDEKNYEFKVIAKLSNDFAQWFATEWYACGALQDFWPEFSKYLDVIKQNIGAYLMKVLLGAITDFMNVMNDFYWVVYHHAREEYFDAGNRLGTCIYNRLLAVVFKQFEFPPVIPMK